MGLYLQDSNIFRFILGKFMQKSLQQHLDLLLEFDTTQLSVRYLQKLKQADAQKFPILATQIKNALLGESESLITRRKLQIIENLCQLEGETVMDLACFKCRCIYHLVAVAAGYGKKGHEIKGNFSRNLKRISIFWGTSSIQNVYEALKSKAKPPQLAPIEAQSRMYIWQFIKNNPQLFPANFDYYEYAIKHMMMLKLEKKDELEIFNTIMEILLRYSHSYQVVSKNFRFMLEFFKSSLNQKQLGLSPFEACKRILNNFKTYQIDNIFVIGSLGLSWTEADILNCINNTLKLGITESTCRILKAFIQMFKRVKKYVELVQAYQKNVHKIFVFLKYPQLYAASLKTLKEFILGPWPVSSLYNNFATRSIEFSKVKNLGEHKEFILLLACVVEKYKLSTIVADLQQLIKPFSFQAINSEKIRAQTLEYDWKVFSKPGSTTKQDKNTEDYGENRGIINIGNSCYMNSFIQSLFMTKEYRRKILQASTLSVEKNVLTKLEQIYKESREGKNLALIARETVRPLAQLQRTFSLLLKSQRPAINPNNIKKISPVQFQNMNQHDCIEFGRFLIQTISKSIDHVFQGEITTEIECPYCKARRKMTQSFLDFMLTSSNQEVETIQSMINASLVDQYLQDLRCESCNNTDNTSQNSMIDQKQQENSQNQPQVKRKSIKRHWISKEPNYLILTLKRFQYNLKENKNVKRQFKVELAQSFKLNETEYIMYSFIVHRGTSANSGHYFTFARASYKQEVKSWLCLNDAIVTKLDDFSKVIEFLAANQEDTPYILFGVQKKYWTEHCKKLEQPITLRAPLQSFIQKDDAQYLKQKNKSGTLDLSQLKFATGSFYRKDEDDNDPRGGLGGFNNNPIM